MTPRELHNELSATDTRLAGLVPWEVKLTAAKKERLLRATHDARDEIVLIEHGLKSGHGRPNDPFFEPFDQGWPGLIETRRTIAELLERRAALADALPNEAVVADVTRRAEAQADEIRQLAQTIDARTTAAASALTEAARLLLAVAQDTRTLWERNTALDRFTRDANVARPDTPRRDAMVHPLAASLGRLLFDHFIAGGQPDAIDTSLIRQIERNAHGG